MGNCAECGAKIDDTVSFCPECGHEVTQTETKASATGETAPCQKCDSTISIEADRCRHCGFEPSVGIIGGILMWVIGGIGTVFALIAIISIVLVFGDLALTSGVLAFVITGGIAAVCFGLIYVGIRNQLRGPTEDPPLQWVE